MTSSDKRNTTKSDWVEFLGVEEDKENQREKRCSFAVGKVNKFTLKWNRKFQEWIDVLINWHQIETKNSSN